MVIVEAGRLLGREVFNASPRERMERAWYNAGATFTLGDNINFTGTALDSEDGDWIIMELVEGPSLKDHQPENLEDAITIATQLCEALEHAHRHGLVHRDLKPANVLLADSSGAPRFVRTIACDKVVGLHLALAVVSGIVQKTRTGKGVCIEAPMLESMVSFLMSEHLAGHKEVPDVSSTATAGWARAILVDRSLIVAMFFVSHPQSTFIGKR